jgi:hypothetical protein
MRSLAVILLTPSNLEPDVVESYRQELVRCLGGYLLTINEPPPSERHRG